MLDALDPIADKKSLRAVAMRRRSEAALKLAPLLAGEAVRDHFLAAIAMPPGAAVSGFWPMGEEIDARPLFLALAGRGHPIGLPIVVRRGEPLVFRRWRPGQELVPGGFNVMVPRPEEPEIVPEVVITPLLLFDADGFRLGYGGGFYDRTLARLRAGGGAVSVGVAFAAQEVDQVPREPFDQPMDWIVTEDGVRRFGPTPGET